MFGGFVYQLWDALIGSHSPVSRSSSSRKLHTVFPLLFLVPRLLAPFLLFWLGSASDHSAHTPTTTLFQYGEGTHGKQIHGEEIYGGKIYREGTYGKGKHGKGKYEEETYTEKGYTGKENTERGNIEKRHMEKKERYKIHMEKG